MSGGNKLAKDIPVVWDGMAGLGLGTCAARLSIGVDIIYKDEIAFAALFNRFTEVKSSHSTRRERERERES